MDDVGVFGEQRQLIHEMVDITAAVQRLLDVLCRHRWEQQLVAVELVVLEHEWVTVLMVHQM